MKFYLVHYKYINFKYNIEHTTVKITTITFYITKLLYNYKIINDHKIKILYMCFSMLVNASKQV